MGEGGRLRPGEGVWSGIIMIKTFTLALSRGGESIPARCWQITMRDLVVI